MRKALQTFLALTCLAILGMSSTGPAWAVNSADTRIFNGYYDGDTANAATELSFRIGNVYGGIPPESLRHAVDTVIVDTGFAFSSIRLLNVPDQTTKAQDSVFLRYYVQNYGNWTDSLDIFAYLIDTSFIPNYFNVMNKDSVAARTDNNGDIDTFHCGIQLSPGALDSFVIKFKIPKSDTAVDRDTIKMVLRMRDRHRLGTNDTWPDTSSYPVMDTTNTYIQTHNSPLLSDTIWDYGDTQYDTVKLTIGGPQIKLYKRTALVNGSRKPGNFIRYTIYYDNDGSDSTRDSTYIVDYLPTNVALVDTDSVWAGTSGASGKIKTDILYNGTWLRHIPDKNTPAGMDSLLRVRAVRFVVAPGIDTTSGDNTTMLRADDSTGTDAGWIKFRVRIR
jgi:hypothetical protein